MERTAWPALLASILFTADVLVVLLSLVVTLCFDGNQGGAISGPLYRVFNVNREANVPTWYSSTQLFVLAMMVALLAWNSFRRDTVSFSILCFLAATLLLFSLDEAAQFHERLGVLADLLLPGGDRADTTFDRTGVWMFMLGLPVTFVMLLGFLKLKPTFARRPAAFSKFVIGLLTMMAGAIGLESLINFVARDQKILAALVIHAEELLEFVGVTLMVWAAAELLHSHNLRIVLDPD